MISLREEIKKSGQAWDSPHAMIMNIFHSAKRCLNPCRECGARLSDLKIARTSESLSKSRYCVVCGKCGERTAYRDIEPWNEDTPLPLSLVQASTRLTAVLEDVVEDWNKANRPRPVLVR